MKYAWNRIIVIVMLITSIACPAFAQHQWVHTDADKIYYVEDSSIIEGHSGYEVDIISTFRDGGNNSNREHRVFYYRYDENRWHSYIKGASKNDKVVDQSEAYIQHVHNFCLNYLKNH